MSRRKSESRGQKTESGDLLFTGEGIVKQYEQHFVCELCCNQELYRIDFIRLEFRLIHMLLFGRLEDIRQDQLRMVTCYKVHGEWKCPSPPRFLPPSSSSSIRTDLETIAKWLHKLISDKCHSTGAATAEKRSLAFQYAAFDLVFFSARQAEQLHRLHAKNLPVYAPDWVFSFPTHVILSDDEIP